MIVFEENIRLESADAFSRPVRGSGSAEGCQLIRGVLCLVNNSRFHHKNTGKEAIGEGMSKAWPPVSFLWQVGVSVGLLMRWWLGRAAGQTGGGSQECNAGTVWSSGHTWALQSWCLFPCDFGQAY